MHTTHYLPIAISILLILSGCTSIQESWDSGGYTIRKPSQMAKYHSPQDAIDRLKLNGRDGKGQISYHETPFVGYTVGGQYVNTTHDESSRRVTPHHVMDNLCISQNGFFTQVAPTRFKYLTSDPHQVLKRPGLAQQFGTFKCQSDQRTWVVSIEPLSAEQSDALSYPKGNQVMGRIMVKTQVISDTQPTASRP